MKIKNIYALIVLLTLLIYPHQIYSQNNTFVKISADSMLSLFVTKHPFDVLYMNLGNQIDYKSCYKDQRLKPYFMSWFNPDSAIVYYLKKDLLRLVNKKGFMDSEIKGFIKKKKRDSILDSVLRNPKLYNLYKDSAVTDYYNDSKSNYQRNRKKLIPSQTFSYHARLAYPESYTLIKNYWIRSGKKSRGAAFDALLFMQDPEVQEIYTRKIDNYLNDKKINYDFRFIQSFYGDNIYFLNSFSYKQWFKFLVIDKKVDVWGDGTFYEYFYCDELKAFANQLYEFGEDITPNQSCEKYAADKEHIIKKSKGYLKYLDEQNLYWKRNIKYFRSGE